MDSSYEPYNHGPEHITGYHRNRTGKLREFDYKISRKNLPEIFVDKHNITWYLCSEVDGYILMEDHRERVFDYLIKDNYVKLNHRYKVTPYKPGDWSQFYIIPDWTVFDPNIEPEEESSEEDSITDSDYHSDLISA
ncbi:hypothetical protein ACJMK2_028300 [Sinanodonta woodiana]|uniref:Uncharacterized protein n=1 Tax=Sinanodonta woodiana TaxID=1069815 RepID=A0ABD3X8X3_SINWO